MSIAKRQACPRRRAARFPLVRWTNAVLTQSLSKSCRQSRSYSRRCWLASCPRSSPSLRARRARTHTTAPPAISQPIAGYATERLASRADGVVMPLVATHAPCHLSYVIFSMQRSGTTTLCRDLNRLKKNCLFELFNWGEHNAGLRWGKHLNISAEQAERWPMEYISRVLRAENTTRPIGQHIAKIGSMDGPTRVQCQSGFKLFPGHHILPEAAAKLASTCIILRR